MVGRSRCGETHVTGRIEDVALGRRAGHVVDQGQAHSRANRCSFTRRTALGGGHGGIRLCGRQGDTTRALQRRARAQTRAACVVQHRQCQGRCDGHTTRRSRLGRGCGLVCRLGIERHLTTALQACAILDLGRAPVARDVDRHRSADAHLAAACAFVHRRGLGCDVCVVFCCKRHRTRARINGGATAHHGLAAGVNQVQRQRTSNTDLAATRARRGFGLYGVGAVTGHIGHPGVQREPVGVDHSAAADDRISHRGHFIDRHCSANAHLRRAALGLAIGIGLWQCAAVGRDLGIGVV